LKRRILFDMAQPVVWIDVLSRTLNAKERRAFEQRQKRLAGQFGKSALAASEKMVEELGAPGRLTNEGLRIRTSFSYLRKPAPEGVSDRRAPRRELRPSATRISSSQGAALRFYLTALAAAQIDKPPGRVAKFDLPLTSYSGELGWTDLVASGAEPSGRGRTSSSIREKKGRTLRTALNTLADAGLVHLPGAPGRRGRHDGFDLLNEAGTQLKGDPVEYHVPIARDDYFTLPAEFVTRGWIHVLEDSEITLLLMTACRRGALDASTANADILPGEVAMPADVRLRHYGIARDPFSTARKTLEWFGLLDVREITRHDDGRAEDGETRLHRLSLSHQGFAADALTTVLNQISVQLDR
jgi:hypothetical protein